MYREKRIYSGPIFEAEIYPIYESGRKMPAGRGVSSEAQKKLNERNARKRLIRLINTNFGAGDLAVTLTYRDDQMPDNEKEVKRHVTNYIRRLRSYARKQQLEEVKYIYVIECQVSRRTGLARWHVHMIMSAMDREIVESLWPYGDWTNTKRLQPNERGLEAIANYLCKDPKGSKRWAQSKNLKKPIIKKPIDGKITKLGARRMATTYVDDAAYFERRYKGYKFVECQAVWNDINGNWYIYITMVKKR